MQFKYILLVTLLMVLTSCQPAVPETEEPPWKTIQLQEVSSQEQFSIKDFEGKTILLESFAVWCPVCTRQQERMKALHEQLGDAFVSISLDTDPNENANIVVDHKQRHGFNWRYAISPTEMTQALIEEFGVGVVNAPSVPIIVICQDGRYHMMDRGVKSVDTLKAALVRCSE